MAAYRIVVSKQNQILDYSVEVGLPNIADVKRLMASTSCSFSMLIYDAGFFKRLCKHCTMCIAHTTISKLSLNK